MKPKPTLLSTLILLSGICFAQPNYLPGYIIDNNLDTIRGFINYRNWERNPEAITFITAMDHPEQLYLVTDIKQFAVADEIYVSTIVDKMSIENFNGLLEYDAAIKTIKDTVFLQTLARGSKDLLFLKDKDGIEQFYIQGDTSLMLLKYKKYKVDNGGGVAFVENKTYIGQLNLLLMDCSSLHDKLKNIDYTKTDLAKLFSEYYKCTNQATPFEKKEEKIIIKVGVLAGISHTNLDVNGSASSLNSIPFESSTDFSGGLSFDFILARNLGKWSLAEELLYTSYLAKGQEANPFNTAMFELGFSYIKINNMFRYRAPVGKFSVFGNAGMSFAIGLDQTNKRYTESIFHPPIYSLAVAEVKSTEIGLLVGVGASFKAFSLQARYEAADGFSVYANVATPTRRWFVLAGYTF
jgi:hypothetical protein